MTDRRSQPALPQINPGIFRTADIRGRVNDEELNPRSVELLGRAYGTFLKRNGITKSVVGYDNRDCSTSFHAAIVEGLRSTGCDVVSIGMCLTPMLYWSQYYFKSEGGVMITGSHNPSDWSGFKMAKGYSYTIVGDEVQHLRKLIEADDFETGRGDVRIVDIENEFYNDLLSRVSITKPFKVVVDCGNGTAGRFAPKLLRRAGCDVTELYCALDTSFPHHFPDPTIVEHHDDIRKLVKQIGADLGMSFDGDGDRFGCDDDQANIIWADRLMMLWSRSILERDPGAKIVFDVKCSQLLVDDIKAHGGEPVMWKTGHPFIKSKLKETHAALAGEMSGHVFFVERYYGYDDALYAALRLLEYLSRDGRKLSEVMAELPATVVTPEIRVDAPDEIKYEVSNELAAKFRADGFEVIDIDGARVHFAEGWGLCRASSNMPMLILRFESTSWDGVQHYVDLFREKLSAYPEVSTTWENLPPQVK